MYILAPPLFVDSAHFHLIENHSLARPHIAVPYAQMVDVGMAMTDFSEAAEYVSEFKITSEAGEVTRWIVTRSGDPIPEWIVHNHATIARHYVFEAYNAALSTNGDEKTRVTQTFVRLQSAGTFIPVGPRNLHSNVRIPAGSLSYLVMSEIPTIKLKVSGSLALPSTSSLQAASKMVNKQISMQYKIGLLPAPKKASPNAFNHTVGNLIHELALRNIVMPSKEQIADTLGKTDYRETHSPDYIRGLVHMAHAMMVNASYRRTIAHLPRPHGDVMLVDRLLTYTKTAIKHAPSTK